MDTFFSPVQQLSPRLAYVKLHDRDAVQIKTLAVSAGSVNAAVRGGGLITVRPRSSLAAAVNGGGEVRYAGNPAVSSAINGGGAVHRIR